MKPVSGFGALVMAGVVTLGSGCVATRMVVPPEASGAADALEVRDRGWVRGGGNEDFKLGPYAVVNVHRSWSTGSKSEAGPWRGESSHTPYAYELDASGRRLSGQCEVDTSTQAVGFLGWSKQRMSCTCADAELVLSSKEKMLRVGGRAFELSPIYETQSASAYAVAGFRADGDGFVAAVDVLQPGAMWLRRDLDEVTREQVACALAGLMLRVNW